MNKCTIIWFRDDLRLTDHAALLAAARANSSLICHFIFDEESPGMRPLGGASRWWLAQSLRALDRSLQKLGQRLVLRRGAAVDVLPALAAQAGATQVFWNRRYERAGIVADETVIQAL